MKEKRIKRLVPDKFVLREEQEKMIIKWVLRFWSLSPRKEPSLSTHERASSKDPSISGASRSYSNINPITLDMEVC